MIEEGVIEGDKSRAEVADAFRAKEKKIVNAVNKNIGKLKTLEDKVLAGQHIANSLKRREQLLARRIRDDYYFPKDMRKEASKKVIASKYYDDVRSYFNDLQSLGQFTEQYGARGTYDKLLEGLSKDGGILKDIETNLFFIRKDLPKEKAENLRIIYNILQRRSTMSSNAILMSDTAGRGITDQQLLKSAKDENLGIFKDAKTIIKRKDGTEKTVDTPKIPDMTGDSEFINGLNYNDLKRLLFLTTQKMNRGGLVQMKKGGVVPMKNMEQQMEMFEEGGLMDEGGTVDPVSGNDVPPGSTQEEVRDDIPAQLSEGEFVFPADVVRYIGLEKLMQMRQEAKAGLARMEDMGQMGNADEATIPDNLPFTIDDLDMEDDGLEMAQGGIVQMANGGSVGTQVVVYGPDGTAYNNPAAAQAAGVTNYTLTKPTTGQITPPQAAAPVQAASAQPVQPGTVELSGTRFTPTAVQGVMPTFQETIGAGVIGVDYEMVDYVNEAGQIIQLRKSKSTGEMLDPIPEGYTLKSETPVTTTPTTVETARVTDDGGRDDDVGATSGATIAFGGTKATGKRAGLVDNAFQGSLSFTGFSLADAKGFGLTGLSSLANSLTGGKVGEPVSLSGNQGAVISNIIDPKTKAGLGPAKTLDFSIALNADQYNSLVSRAGVDKVTSRTELADITTQLAKINDSLAGETLDYGRAKYLAESIKIGRQDEIEDSIAQGKGLDQAIADALGRDRGKVEGSGIFGTNIGARDRTGAVSAAERAAMSAQEKAAVDAAMTAYAERMSTEEPDDNDNDRGNDDRASNDFGSDMSSAPICLTEDMKVNLNGVIDFVTNVKVGDIVDNTVVTEVLHKHMREGYYVVNGELKITNDHPVLANGSWKRTEDLVLGDYINSVEVTSLEYVEQVTPTVYVGTADDRYDVYTEGEVYTVHGQYKNGLKKAA
jgi:hypothetical protein